MCFSIPASINPTFIDATTLLPPAGIPQIGSSIKDLPQGAETTMKKAHNLLVAKLEKQYEADKEKNLADLKVATAKAEDAEKVISQARLKKIIAITTLAVSIIAIIGVIVATAVTGILPILCAAILPVALLIPSGYYTHIFSKIVSSLEADIRAPKALQSPVLDLPQYSPLQDLELLQTRISAQNLLASTTNLHELSSTRYTQDEITRYALLDRVCPIQADKKPVFYAKCIQLIKAYNSIEHNKKIYKETADREYRKLEKELADWKANEDSHIFNHENMLRDRTYVRPHRPVPGIIYGANTILSHIDLANKKNEVAKAYANRLAQNRTWINTTTEQINTAFEKARAFLEAQFTAAKAEAF